MNPILELLESRYSFPLYEDNTFKKHLKDVEEGKCKKWCELGSYKESEKMRRQLLIERAKNDQIPQLTEKLENLLGILNWEKTKADTNVFLCKWYISELNKFKKKKKLTYKDTIKLDDLFNNMPSKLHPLKAYITKQVVLGFIEKALTRDDDFKQKLFELLQIYNFIGTL